MEIKREPPTPLEPVVGVDVGVKQAAVVSDGRRLENQRPFALHLGKLGKLQRRLSKKQQTKDPQTGQNHVQPELSETTVKVARKHQQIADIRRDSPTQVHHRTSRTCGAIGIEDLNILGMMANRKLARAVADAAMGQLLQFLKTKVANAGGDLLHRLPLVSLAACAVRAVGMSKSACRSRIGSIGVSSAAWSSTGISMPP